MTRQERQLALSQRGRAHQNTEDYLNAGGQTILAPIRARNVPRACSNGLHDGLEGPSYQI